MKQKVVVIGHGYTSRLAIIRSVGMAGYDVDVVVIYFRKKPKNKPIDCNSKYVDKVFYCPSGDEKALVELLMKYYQNVCPKPLLIPESDFSAAVIDNNQRSLRDLFLLPHIHYTPGAIAEWMDKTRQKSLAKKVGMNTAGATVIKIENKQFSIPTSIKYPCFTKPLATIAGGKRFLRRCNNEAELKEILNLAKNIGDLSVLVEDFKTIDTEYAVLGFSNGKDVVIPGIIQITEMSHGNHYGVACQGKIMSTDGFENIINQFNEFILQIGYIGLFDIDFFKSDGILYFGELNLRFGGSGYAITKMGVNLPAMFVKTLIGENCSNMQKKVCGSAIYVNERMCLDDWYAGFITSVEYHKLINQADIKFIDDDEDKKPQKAFDRERYKLSIKMRIKHILRR